MAKQTNLYLTKNANLASNTIVNADASTLKTVFTAGADGSILKMLNAVSDDTSARVIKIYIDLTPGTPAPVTIGAVSVPAASGNDGSTASVNLIGAYLLPSLPFDSSGNRYLNLPAGAAIKVSSTTTVTAAKTVTIVSAGEDY